MFVRIKRAKSGGKTLEYLQVVENQRVHGKTRQRVIATLGRRDQLEETGQVDGLLQSLARYSRQVEVLDAFREGSLQAEWSRSWGPVLVFRRLWEQFRIPQLLQECVRDRRIQFDLDAVAFALTLQRLLFPGSDLAGAHWVQKMLYPPFWSLELQHFYRALDLLAEHKDRLEAGLFESRKDLFTVDVDLVLFDTSTLYFEGEGPPELARRGHSKDYRPQNPQVVFGIVMGRDGFPLACEVWPGNTTDVTTVKAVVAMLRRRFNIQRVVLVCDQGMMSAANLRRIRAAGMHYIIGARMRVLNEVKRDVLSRAGRYSVVADNLHVKEVWVGKRRYVLCLNPEEAERDRAGRETMLQKLKEQMRSGGAKSLVGNRGYRTYLKVDKGAVAVDHERVKQDARYDGKFVLRTSTDLPTAEVALAYKSLFTVEALNRTFKSLLETRPVFHQNEERVRGHIFGSFLAMLLATALRKRVEERLDRQGGERLCWQQMIEDLRAFHGIKLQLNGNTYLLRTEMEGLAHRAFEAAGVRPPPRVQPWSEPTTS